MKYLFIISTIIFFIGHATASPIEVKIEISNVDCQLEQSTIYIDIFIRKNTTAQNDIYLENQNYRFAFDAQSLDEQSFFIQSEGDLLSGFNSNPDGSLYLFGAHNLTGSIEHIVSYNIDFLGGDSAFNVPLNWVKVGTLGATLLTNIECIGTDILTAADYPMTTLIYKDGQSANKIIDTDPVVYDFDECLHSFCNLCNQYLTLDQQENNYISGEILEHKVSEYIDATNIIGNQSDIIYNVHQSAILQAGFEVESNSKFEVKLEGCND